MNISDNMAITEFLQEHGYQPTSVKGNNWWYLSPLRNELTASFKVDVNKNVWYDFGLGKGGNLRTLKSCSFMIITSGNLLIMSLSQSFL